MTRRRLPLTEIERDELLDAVRVRRNNWVTYAPYLDMIRPSLRDAELIPEEAWDDIAALGSVVWVRRRGKGAAAEAMVLVHPRDEDESRGRVSVLTPLGWELLGARAGDAVYAATESGLETYFVERVSSGGVAAGADDRLRSLAMSR